MTDRTINFTEGVIWRQITAFAIPLFISSMMQQLYGTADMMFVGRFLGREAAAAVGASTFLVSFLIGLFAGISVGVSVVAARCFGADDLGMLCGVIRTSWTMCICGGLFLTAFGSAMTPTLLHWLDVPEEIMTLAVSYMRIYLLSVPSMLAFGMGAGVLRAAGDSVSPVKYQFAGGLLNVAADAFFIIVLGLGVRGAALATMCSQTAAAALVIMHLTKLDARYRLTPLKLGADIGVMRSILSVGLPAGFQSTVITLSNLLIQHDINSLGVLSAAAFALFFKIENFLWMPIVSFGQTITPFVSQNMGAGQPERARRGIRVCIAVGLVITASISAALLLLPGVFIGMFTADPELADMCGRVMFLPFLFYFLYVFLEVISSALRGMGHSFSVMMIVVFNMSVTRIALLKLAVHLSPDAPSVSAVYPLTWIAAVIMLALYYRKHVRV